MRGPSLVLGILGELTRADDGLVVVFGEKSEIAIAWYLIFKLVQHSS